jgi:predicted DNA-binding protein
MSRNERKITFRMNEPTWLNLRRLSEDRGVSIASLLREIIRTYLDRH